MRVEVNRTIDDFLEVFAKSRRQTMTGAIVWWIGRRELSHAMKQILRGLVLMMAGSLLVGIASAVLMVRWSGGWFWGCAFALYVFLFYAAMLKRALGDRAIRRRLEADTRLADTFAIEADEHGMRFTSWRSRSEIEWRALCAVHETDNLVDDTSGAHTVPKRAFATSEQLDTFVSFVRERIRAVARGR